jgi:hypothetical protein
MQDISTRLQPKHLLSTRTRPKQYQILSKQGNTSNLTYPTKASSLQGSTQKLTKKITKYFKPNLINHNKKFNANKPHNCNVNHTETAAQPKRCSINLIINNMAGLGVLNGKMDSILQWTDNFQIDAFLVLSWAKRPMSHSDTQKYNLILEGVSVQGSI